MLVAPIIFSTYIVIGAIIGFLFLRYGVVEFDDSYEGRVLESHPLTKNPIFVFCLVILIWILFLPSIKSIKIHK